MTSDYIQFGGLLGDGSPRHFSTTSFIWVSNGRILQVDCDELPRMRILKSVNNKSTFSLNGHFKTQNVRY